MSACKLALITADISSTETPRSNKVAERGSNVTWPDNATMIAHEWTIWLGQKAIER